jgi:hypothetical protein
VAVTIAIVKRNVEGGAREVVFDITGPASYTTGGEALTAAQQAQLMPEAGLPAAADYSKAVFFESEVETANARYLILDKTNNKMMFFAGSTQVAGATNLSAVVIRGRIEYGFVAVQ